MAVEPDTEGTTGGMLSLRLSRLVLDLLGREADLFSIGMSKSPFIRTLVALTKGPGVDARYPNAPERELLRSDAVKIQQHRVQFDERTHPILVSLANRAGGISPSAVVTLLTLDWCRISPFVLNRRPPPPPPSPVAAAPRSGQTSRATSRLALSFTPPVLELIESEGLALYGDRSRGRFVRFLVERATHRSYKGFSRSPDSPTIPPLDDVAHEVDVLKVSLTPEQTAGLDKLRWIAGGLGRSAIITLLVLDWCETGPWWLDRAVFERAS